MSARPSLTCRPWIVVGLLIAGEPAAAGADLEVTTLRSVPWLTAHSAVICVAEYDDPTTPTEGRRTPPTEEGKESGEGVDGNAAEPRTQPRVTKVLKAVGDAARFPLAVDRSGRVSSARHQGFGARLLFVSAEGELLGAVGLNRPTPARSPTLRDALYGVGEYGELYLTEQDLFRAIHRSLARPPARLLPAVDRRRSGVAVPVWPAPDFPLDESGNIYQIVVDFHVARRTHYLHQLETGDLGERLYAVSQLALIDDVGARDGIRAAARNAVVPPPFYEVKGFDTIHGERLPDDLTATQRLRTYAEKTMEGLRRALR